MLSVKKTPYKSPVVLIRSGRISMESSMMARQYWPQAVAPYESGKWKVARVM
jgi:hypothetical protein